jgi:cobalt-zinc-cadmium efflux system protein
VTSVHDLHIWAVKAEQPLLSAHLVVRDIARWESVMETSHAMLAEQFEILHATLQPEPMIRTVHWREPPEHEHEHERD